MNPLHSQSEIASLFGGYGAQTPSEKNGCPPPKQGQPGDVAMQGIPQHRQEPNEFRPAPIEVPTAPRMEQRRPSIYLADRIAAAKRLPPGQMHSESTLLSPEAAQYILSNHNIGNRPVRQSRVDEFVRTIREGRWKVTSQGISFSRDGHLNNGQHRLTAIASAGVTVGMYVTFGEERDVFDVLDTGAVRGGSDALNISGYKNTSCLAASAKFLTLVENNRIFNPPKVHNDEILEIVARNPRLEEATVPGHAIGGKLRCSTAATTVAFYRIMVLTKQPDRLEHFLKLLKEGTLPDPRDPILVLRDGLLTKKLDAHCRLSSMKTFAQYAAVINAWNKHLRGRKGSLRWEHPEPLPRPE